MVNINMFYY